VTLNLCPAADGTQHCAVAGMRNTLDGYAAKVPKWKWLQRLIASNNSAVELRSIVHGAPVHPIVTQRFPFAPSRRVRESVPTAQTSCGNTTNSKRSAPGKIRPIKASS
jgi:hypothetical protein